MLGIKLHAVLLFAALKGFAFAFRDAQEFNPELLQVNNKRLLQVVINVFNCDDDSDSIDDSVDDSNRSDAPTAQPEILYLCQDDEQVSSTSCRSDPLFQDSVRNTCDWYCGDACGTVADSYKNSRGVSANRACCVCGGGYEFYPTANSNGNDIGNVSESIVFLECDSDPTCDGFNSNGWVKHTVRPKSQWHSWTNDATKGLYVKKTALDGFNFVPFMSSGGNDIEKSNGESVLDYAEECYTDPECKGFNSNGWLKYEIKPYDEWSRWTEDASKGFYVKDGVDNDNSNESCKSDPLFQDSFGDTCDWYDTYTSNRCGTVADSYKNSRGVSANRACCVCGGGYEFYPTAGSDGNDIDNVSESVVFQECDSDPTCDGFNSNGWVKHTVRPKSQWDSWTNDATKGLYVKKTALDGFDFVPFMDSDGNDIEKSNGESVLDHAEECYANPECKGFNSNGWLKYEIKPYDEWSRWTEDASKGFYVKKA